MFASSNCPPISMPATRWCCVASVDILKIWLCASTIQSCNLHLYKFCVFGYLWHLQCFMAGVYVCEASQCYPLFPELCGLWSPDYADCAVVHSYWASCQVKHYFKQRAVISGIQQVTMCHGGPRLCRLTHLFSRMSMSISAERQWLKENPAYH